MSPEYLASASDLDLIGLLRIHTTNMRITQQTIVAIAEELAKRNQQAFYRELERKKS